MNSLFIVGQKKKKKRHFFKCFVLLVLKILLCKTFLLKNICNQTLDVAHFQHNVAWFSWSKTTNSLHL